MQAGENEIMGEKPDNSTPFEGDELDDSTSFEGDELDDSTSFGGDELDDVSPDEANQPQAAPPGDQTEDVQAETSEGEEVILLESVPERKKKTLFYALAGLCVLAAGAAACWTVLRPGKAPVHYAVPVVATPVSATVTTASEHVLDFDAFVIPYHRDDSHYISFSVSLRPSERAVLEELRQKQEIFRGRIYELIRAQAARQAGRLSPAVIKEMVSDSVNAWLSAGSAGGVYVTQFIII